MEYNPEGSGNGDSHKGQAETPSICLHSMVLHAFYYREGFQLLTDVSFMKKELSLCMFSTTITFESAGETTTLGPVFISRLPSLILRIKKSLNDLN